MMEALTTPLAWTSPFGVGFFLVCFAAFMWMITRLGTPKK